MTFKMAVTAVRFVASEGSPQGILPLHKINASSNLYPHAFRAKYACKKWLATWEDYLQSCLIFGRGPKIDFKFTPFHDQKFVWCAVHLQWPSRFMKFKAFNTDENEIKTLKIAAKRFCILFLFKITEAGFHVQGSRQTAAN